MIEYFKEYFHILNRLNQFSLFYIFVINPFLLSVTILSNNDTYVEKDEFKHQAIVPFLNVLWNTFFLTSVNIQQLIDCTIKKVELTFP